jgi:hypothetical protein
VGASFEEQKMIRSLIIAAAAASMSAAAFAAEPARMTAASCVPVSGPYKVTATKVTFRSGQTGKIILHCVTRTEDLTLADSNDLALIVTYRDSGGAASTGYVKATLVGVQSGTGIGTSTLQFNSNAETPASGVTVNVGSQIPSLPIGSYFHMRIELKRATTGQTVEFYGAGYEFP